MLTKVHERLGTAGFVIAIVALFAALGGGAYAASGGLSGKQKKEVEKIAKKYAGKPGKNGASGATGPAGANGTNGSKGDTGAQGEKGTPGAVGAAGAKGDTGNTGNTGAPGASPSVVELAATDPGKCEGSGGAKIIPVNPSESAVSVCNGSGGGGGGFPATLPSGSTETGMWTVSSASPTFGPAVVTTVSFNVPLATKSVAVFFIEASGTPTQEELEKCPGTAAAPIAEPGYLCVYPKVAGLAFLAGEPLTVGAELIFAQGAEGFGTWAVTAA